MSTGLPLLDRIETDKRLEASLKPIHFRGQSYDVVFDCKRLNAQQRRVYDLMIDGQYRTLRQIASATDDPEASISARLRDFNNHPYLQRFLVMDSERVPGLESKGVWRYKLRKREQ